MSNTFTVPKIQDTDTASAATLNAPLNYIQSSLNNLAQSTGIRSANIQYAVPVDSTVSVGDLVYFNTSTSKFQKALADILSNSVGTDGQTIEADSCHVQGFILSINTTQHSAVMLRSGYCSDSHIVDTLGVGAQAGLYYLSPQTAGKATKLPGWDVRIPCINYYGNGKFAFMPFNSSYVGQGQPVIRRVLSNNLTVTTGNYGSVVIDQNPYSGSDVQLSATAISAITSTNQTTKTPVVSALKAGPGMTAAYQGYVVWKLSLSSLVGKPVPATDFDLRGTLRVNEGLLTYTVFPKNAQTSMTMMLNVPSSASSTAISSVKVWMTTRGPGGCTYNISLYWLPFSDVGQATAIPSSFATSSVTTSGTLTDRLYYLQSQVVQTSITTQGAIVAVITTSGNASDCYVHQAGFVFDTQTASDSLSGSESSSTGGGLTRQDVMDILAEVLKYNPTYTE